MLQCCKICAFLTAVQLPHVLSFIAQNTCSSKICFGYSEPWNLFSLLAFSQAIRVWNFFGIVLFLIYFKWACPASFLFFSVPFKHEFYRKNCRLQQDSKSDNRSRSRARWPLGLNHVPHAPDKFVFWNDKCICEKRPELEHCLQHGLYLNHFCDARRALLQNGERAEITWPRRTIFYWKKEKRKRRENSSKIIVVVVRSSLVTLIR